MPGCPRRAVSAENKGVPTVDTQFGLIIVGALSEAMKPGAPRGSPMCRVERIATPTERACPEREHRSIGVLLCVPPSRTPIGVQTSPHASDLDVRRSPRRYDGVYVQRRHLVPPP